MWWFTKIEATKRWPSGDGPHILGTAERLAQLLIDGEISLFIHCFSSLLGPHPPFAYLLHMVGSFFELSSGSHLLGGAFALFLIANALFRLNAGIVGFIWVFSLTPVWLQAESAGIDLIAGAVVLQSLSHLISSNKLKNKRATWLWGAWMGVAFMTKYTAPIFLLGPCFVVAYWVFRYKRFQRLFSAVACFCVVAIPWWSTHLKQVLGYVQMAGNSESGLLTNKAIIDTPWYDISNLSWYPAAVANAVGWESIVVFLFVLSFGLLFRRYRESTLIFGASMLIGWLTLNAQSQRQDRYIIPAYSVAGALMGSTPLGVPTLVIASMLFNETKAIYTLSNQAPAERNQEHDITNAGELFPKPSLAYYPTAQNPSHWKVDEALQKLRGYHGSDEGTLGFLLDERNGAPGYGVILSRATALGFRWHIATVVMAQNGPQHFTESHRPTASIFVGPFWLGNWPSKEFTVLLSILDTNPNPKVVQWLKENEMELAESWELPHQREGRIYIRSDSSE
jgi:hypothetical protein